MIVSPPSKRIVFNRDEDHGVSVHCPTAGAFFWMQRGGLWGDRPRGFFDEQVRRQVESGIKESAARMWINALQYGGKTEAEAWEIICYRNCHNPTGYAHELVEFADLPDRWFRPAWARSRNGGPIYVDLKKAQGVQFTRIRGAVKSERLRRDMDIDDYRKPLRVSWIALEKAIRNARDEAELARVWPDGLTLPMRSSAPAALQAPR